MMQKRSTLSLLLISFILVFAFSASANEVSFEDGKIVPRCATEVIDITANPSADAGAVEVIFEITGTGGSFYNAVNVNWDAGFGVLTNHIVDMSGVDNVSPDTIRIAAMLIDAGDACLSSGPTVIAQVEFTTNDNCDGTIVFSGATVSCPSFDISTQFSDCGGTAAIPAAVITGTVTVQNQAPSLAAIADDTVPFGMAYAGLAVGDDFDLPNGCEALSYSVVSGPAGLAVDGGGNMAWTTAVADIGSHAIEIQVEDACGATASQTFTICVSNEAPIIACPEDIVTGLGTFIDVMINASDPDNGPSALVYTLVDDAGTDAALNAATGQLTWQTMFDASYRGIYTFTVAVTDGGIVDPACTPANADTCSFTVTIVNHLVSIEKTHEAIQGQQETVSIFGDISEYGNDAAMGGFDFLIQYDASALTFQSAEEGAFLDSCKWEYFTYRYSPNGNCGTGCPSGEVRVVAIAETNNGGNYSSCWDTSDETELVRLNFLVTNDRTFECMYAPVRFVWYDCGDNTISSKDGNTLFISDRIYMFDSSLINNPIAGNIADPSAPFPTTLGANYVCDTVLENGKAAALRFITFVNGGVDIVCADSIDARGDLNLNEIAYEIADAVLYSNYFVFGLNAFSQDPTDDFRRRNGQIAASDVNADGLSLSVADLVYLIRVVVGDATPYPKEAVNKAAYVNATYQHNNGIVTVSEEVQIAAAHIVVEGDVTPTLLADNMTMASNFDGTNTRIIIYSLENNNFTGNMINVGNSEIVSLDMADFVGNTVTAKWIPSNYAVAQNYPNPFNPTTTIEFSVPVNAEVTMTIYNVNGQTVKEFARTVEAGVHTFEWDASVSASGVYFYRLTAGDFSSVKKMVLLK